MFTFISRSFCGPRHILLNWSDLLDTDKQTKPLQCRYKKECKEVYQRIRYASTSILIAVCLELISMCLHNTGSLPHFSCWRDYGTAKTQWLKLILVAYFCDYWDCSYSQAKESDSMSLSRHEQACLMRLRFKRYFLNHMLHIYKGNMLNWMETIKHTNKNKLHNVTN